MAIAFDAASSNSGTTGTTLVWSHTCTGSNLVLVVGSEYLSLADASNITGITYGAQSLTFIRKNRTDAGNVNTELWYLIAPLTGPHDVTITWDVAPGGQEGGAVSLRGAKQSGQPDAHNGVSQGSSAAPSVSVTTVADQCWLVDSMGWFGSTTTAAADAPQVERWNIPNISSRGGAGSTKGPVGIGATTMSWTLSVSNLWGIAAASFAPAAVVSTLQRRGLYRDRRVR